MTRLPPKLKQANGNRDTSGRRCPGHLRFVRTFACVVPGCDRGPIEACHIRKGTDGGTGLKPSDRFTYSGCSFHHAESHRIGEVSFQKKYGLDLLAIAAEFARESPALRRQAAKARAA